jgi:hypothetical protein
MYTNYVPENMDIKILIRVSAQTLSFANPRPEDPLLIKIFTPSKGEN